MLTQNLISSSLYSIKSPYTMVPKGICIHNTYNDAPAINELNYMKNNTNKVSFHVVIDDNVAIQCIPFNRTAYHAGTTEGNNYYIGVEICYSKSGDTRFVNAEKRASKEVALMLKNKAWGVDKLKTHQDFSGKYCPHRTLDMGWTRFVNMVQAELNALNNVVTPPQGDGGDYYMKTYKNGSTKEIVYQTDACTQEIGYLDPYEVAQCIGEFNNKAVVKYSTSNGQKVGWVKWLGGIQK